ncbi:MAG: ComEC/Rec2 family competence protein [Oscillospiraceae bacterium]
MLFAMLLLFLRRRGLAAAIGIPVVVCYALLTGAAPPVIRRP